MVGTPSGSKRGVRITQTQRDIYWAQRKLGERMEVAALHAGFSMSSAAKLEREAKGQVGPRIRQVKDPVKPTRLRPEAKRALEDFGYFQRRYFGRIPYLWQVEAAHKVVELLESPNKEYLVVNCPPGSGKSTLFAHDIPAWLTCRDRSIRGMIGSATTHLAEGYIDRLRRSFMLTRPLQSAEEYVSRGLALDAEATLAGDFGRFQPVGDIWTRSSFVVEQGDGKRTQEKEATWSGYGQDAGYIGQRFDFVIWDDLVDPKKQRTMEAKEALQDYWDDVSEPRLEPSGLLVLQGQRFAADDLYRYCLNKTTADEFEDDGEPIEPRQMYHHVIYKAHYEELCEPATTHRLTADSYPNGCLLNPWRLSWKELSSKMRNRSDRFEVVYQQQDADPSTVLVPKTWIHGGDGFPGCIDNGERGTVARDRLELPEGLSGPLVSIMTVDPSPTKFWAIEWWIYQPETELRWLMDLEKTPMEAGAFLDYNPATRQFTGLLDEWVKTSNDLRLPITHVIVEDNAAQRFLLQYAMVHQWMALRSVEIIPHSTHRNKSDPEYGVTTIAEHYRFGRVRLPYKRNSDGWVASTKLIDELTKYDVRTGKGSTTDDCIMAHWFLEWNLPKIYAPETAEGKQWRPSWSDTVPGLHVKGEVESRAMAMMTRARV